MSASDAVAQRASLVGRAAADEVRDELRALAVAVVMALPEPGEPGEFMTVTATVAEGISPLSFWLAVLDLARGNLAKIGVAVPASERAS